MRRALFLAAAALAATGLAAFPTVAAAPAKKAAAARDWSRVVALTPEGGYRMGNPAARLKLVEYGSLTCSHCAAFAEEGMPVLVDRYVKSGRLSYEFRNYVRDPADLAGALLSRCGTTANYFALTDSIFRTQRQWAGRLQATTKAQQAELETLTPQQRIPRFAALSGLDRLAVQGGVPAARARACLNDAAAMTRLAKMRQVANDVHKLDGTPMFMINGKKVDATSWRALEPLLGPPGG